MSSPSCDAINACVIIPVYNHGKTVGAVVKGSLQYCSTVLVCDDGSTDGSGENAKAAGAVLLTHAVNQGKGAALRTLFEEAHRRGFRYVICLDADGQHYPEDIPKVAEAVAATPGAIVVGSRDLAKAGAPGSSQFGRKFSNFWVWFESGVKVDDSQCGFRAYPLPEVLQLGGKRSRYDYEVEILLRGAWAGLPVVGATVQVLYPPDRITHFDKFKDSVRISLLNTAVCARLLLPLPVAPLFREKPHLPGLSLDRLRRWAWLGGPGPLWRALGAALGGFGAWGALGAAAIGAGAFPALLAMVAAAKLAPSTWSQWETAGALAGAGAVFGVVEALIRSKLVARAQARSPRGWTGKRHGGTLGNLFFVVMTRLFGRAPAYWCLYPVVLYFVLKLGKERRASFDWLDSVMGPATGLAKWKRTYLHLLWFARTVVDKVLFGASGPELFSLKEERGLDHIVNASASGKGSILLTAHVGNWDFAGAMLRGKLKSPITIVAVENEAENLKKVLGKSNAALRPRVVTVGRGELGALDMLRELREGHMLAMQGDRTLDDRVAVVDFFGRPAAFPVGPFVLAALAGVPVIPTFSFQAGTNGEYEMVAFEPKSYRFDRAASRDAQLKAWVQEYAKTLESVMKPRPYQWFNFYDFWAVQKRPAPAPVEAPVGQAPAAAAGG